ncbi:aminoglycoside phosphotransferase family protein [Flexivirga caeni]|uniref:Aminoglycoside phosphotransferase family protein n=1 Tax=Flexivirga caeni TaxID=2294115 RepID=A0A3M9LYQ4_9MICO|nr:aminoglycoside phosphotransferase family protein [Flexivirga caeni]RNI18362.1 aminoglycoside phosphotransferase family protein [Flexivirga caeni]
MATGFERVAAHVAATLGAAVVSAEPVPGSVANEDFRVGLDDDRCVFVKVGPRTELAAEAWALAQATAAGVPVPKVVAYEEDSAVTPVPYLVLDLLPSDRDLTDGVVRAVGAALKRVHSIEVPGHGHIELVGNPLEPDSVRGQFGTWPEFVGSLLRDAEDLVRVGLLSAEQETAIRREAEGIHGSPLMGDSGVLLHADLKPDHLLPVDGKLTGIIDWGDASAGDPAWDLARASMAGPAVLRIIAEAYPGADDPEVSRLLPIYRVLWNAQALAHEYRAGGDWFAVFQRRIASDLGLG